MEQHASTYNQSQPHIQKDLTPCPLCHQLAYEIHGQKVLFDILNGSKEGRNYVYNQVEERNRNLGRICSRKLNASQLYKEMQESLRRCGCADGKKHLEQHSNNLS